METTKKVEPKKTAQDFAKKYQDLCEETGFRIVVAPVWLARDDGTWSVQLQYTVGQLPKLTTEQQLTKT